MLAIRLEVAGNAAHGSTPWLGDNAVLKAHDAFRRDRDAALQPRVLRPVRPPLDQPRAASRAATPSTRCPTSARWTSTSATSPTRTPARSSPRSARSPTSRSSSTFTRAPAIVSRTNPFVRAARGGGPLDRGRGAERRPRRRLGRRLVPGGRRPAVEFGPVGGGHHGPEEWVSISSLALPPGAGRLRGPAARVARRAGNEPARRRGRSWRERFAEPPRPARGHAEDFPAACCAVSLRCSSCC